MTSKREVFISVDVETSGPIPADYNLLSIGACHVDDHTLTFYRELKPVNKNADPKALEVSRFSLEELARTGESPSDTMKAFTRWIRETVGIDSIPIFVGFNASFDWAFINYYFHKFTGENPFGFSALDIKAYYMGAMKSSWKDTRSSVMEVELKPKKKGDHNALNDAQYQAELFRLIRKRLST